METHVFFECGGLMLEGLYEAPEKSDSDGKPARGVVITHPHPLYGGDMYNPVVRTISSVFLNKGYHALRFNFRGVGASEGGFDNGRGEKDDALSAYAFLSEKGVKHIDFAGYSFGTRVIADISAVSYPDSGLYFVSPPVEFMDFSGVARLPHLKLVVLGSGDEFGSPAAVKKYIEKWNQNASFAMINGADHFYGMYIRDLKSALSERIS